MLPRGERWIDWCDGAEEALRGRLEWPLGGVGAPFDVPPGREVGPWSALAMGRDDEL